MRLRSSNHPLSSLRGGFAAEAIHLRDVDCFAPLAMTIMKFSFISTNANPGLSRDEKWNFFIL